jgi:pyruvate,water dikinase
MKSPKRNGFLNVKLMIPFAEPWKKEKSIAETNKLVQGENGLEVYVMIEIPSNVILADEFALLTDSIGSNDLTQPTLGLDRDSALISYLFSEQNPAVKKFNQGNDPCSQSRIVSGTQ